MKFLSAQFLLQVICDMMGVTGACELVVKRVRIYTILFPLLAYSAELKSIISFLSNMIKIFPFYGIWRTFCVKNNEINLSQEN